MRQIKFRGKRIDNGEWVYGYYFVHLSCTDMCPDMHCIYDGMHIEKMNYHEVIPATVGQFTGLCDKNGVEIYEGDIVQTKYEKMQPISIMWRDGGFYYSPPKKDPKDGGLFCVCEFTTESDVVIGNVHDKPELIVEQ